MRKIAQKIWNKTSIEKNKDTKAVVAFISSPDSVERMIVATKAGKPALAGIVKELEQRFGYCKGFPLNPEAKDKNAKNRRNVGWIVRYVMAEYGYAPVSNSERTRIGADSGSNFFASAAVYTKVEAVPSHDIITLSTDIDRNLTRDDLWAESESLEYQQIKDSVREIRGKIGTLGLDYEFLAKYLNTAGYKHLLSADDVKAIFTGDKVPSEELLDAIVGVFSYFDNFILKDKNAYHDILGGSTDKALKAFYECDINRADVTDVWVYFSTWDAILDGRYNLLSDGKNDENRKILLDAPRFIIKTDKQEFWFHGLTCGYAGQGCGGSQEILLNLGVIEDDGSIIADEIQRYRCLHYYRDDGKWTYHGDESRIDQYYAGLKDKSNFSLFVYNEKLIIAQSYNYGFRYNSALEKEEPTEEWFKVSLYFVGGENGVREIELIKVEEPDNRVLRPVSKDPSYQVILRGTDNREIWLDYPFNDLQADNRRNLYQFFEKLGFDIPREASNSGLFKAKKPIYGLYTK